MPTDNSWNGTYLTTGISNKRIAGQASGNPVNYYHRNVSPNLNLTASQYDQTAINPFVTTGVNCNTQQIQGREIADIDLLLQIIRDSIVYVEFVGENRTLEDVFAYDVIKNDSLLLTDSTLMSFYANQNQSNPITHFDPFSTL